MSDFSEKENLNEELNGSTAETEENAADEFSTVFSDPTEHRKASANQKKKRWPAVIAAFLAVAVLVGGTVAVVKLIPEKEEEDTTPSFEEINVLDLKADDFKSVTVTNKNGTFKLYSEKTTSDSSDTSSSTETVNWYLDGYTKDVINSYSVSNIANSAASIKATREITAKTAEECGLNSPVSKADVVTNDGAEFSVLVGADSPDNSGTYLKLSNNEKIYLVESSTASVFTFDALSLAATDVIPALPIDNADSKYKGEDGTLSSFDTLTVSGKNFPQTVVITPNNDSSMSQFAGFLVTAPTKRIASDNISEVLNLFKNSITVSGAAALDASDKTVKRLGLNKPDLSVSIKLGSISRTYAFKLLESGDYAVWYDGCKLINTVSADTLTVAGYNTSSFYANWVALQSINDLKNLTLKTKDKTYSFDIVYDDSEDAEETYVITYEGKKLVAQNFQNFYQKLISLSCTDFDTDKLSGAADFTVVFNYSDTTKAPYTVEFRKASETRYQYSIDGIDMGKVTYSSVSNVLRTLEKLVAGETIK